MDDAKRQARRVTGKLTACHSEAIWGFWEWAKKSPWAPIFMAIFTPNVMAYEQPQYELISRHEQFEIRRYAPMIVVQTLVSGAFEDVGNEAFRLLAGYIGGENKSKAGMAMIGQAAQEGTTAGEKIAMTAPVMQTPDPKQKDTYEFQFMMPSTYNLTTLPLPTNPRVSPRRVPGRLMAARTYSGAWSRERYREQEAALLSALRAARMQTVGQPIFARYNSPFTFWFLRRNEVLIELRDDQAPAGSPQPQLHGPDKSDAYR